MENLEIHARTLEEAKKKASEQLGVGLDEIDITVLSEGRSGILGLGAEEARIRVSVKSSTKNESNETVAAVKAVLETLLRHMGIAASVVLSTEPLFPQDEGNDKSIVFDVKGDDLGILIGRRGQTLDALQYLVKVIVNQKTKQSVPLIIDVEGYKRRRYEALITLAQHVTERVRTTKVPFKLEPMPANERRIIHLTLANNTDVMTESTGEGEFRKVVILPRRK